MVVITHEINLSFTLRVILPDALGWWGNWTIWMVY
jgi:hypothetical protein